MERYTPSLPLCEGEAALAVASRRTVRNDRSQVVGRRPAEVDVKVPQLPAPRERGHRLVVRRRSQDRRRGNGRLHSIAAHDGSPVESWWHNIAVDEIEDGRVGSGPVRPKELLLKPHGRDAHRCTRRLRTASKRIDRGGRQGGDAPLEPRCAPDKNVHCVAARPTATERLGVDGRGETLRLEFAGQEHGGSNDGPSNGADTGLVNATDVHVSPPRLQLCCAPGRRQTHGCRACNEDEHDRTFHRDGATRPEARRCVGDRRAPSTLHTRQPCIS